MKKIVTLLLIITLLSSSITVFGETNSNILSTEIIYLTDDLYFEIYLTEESSSSSTYATTQTKSASKTYNLKNSDGDVLAKFKLTATFSYNGSASSCTSVSHSTTIYDDAWEFKSASSSKSGKVATGNFTLKKYVLFICTQTVTDSITITCDANGNLS